MPVCTQGLLAEVRVQRLESGGGWGGAQCAWSRASEQEEPSVPRAGLGRQGALSTGTFLAGPLKTLAFYSECSGGALESFKQGE